MLSSFKQSVADCDARSADLISKRLPDTQRKISVRPLDLHLHKLKEKQTDGGLQSRRGGLSSPALHTTTCKIHASVKSPPRPPTTLLLYITHINTSLHPAQTRSNSG